MQMTPFDATEVRIRCEKEEISMQEQQVRFKVHSKARGKRRKTGTKVAMTQYKDSEATA